MNWTLQTFQGNLDVDILVVWFIFCSIYMNDLSFRRGINRSSTIDYVYWTQILTHLWRGLDVNASMLWFIEAVISNRNCRGSLDVDVMVIRFVFWNIDVNDLSFKGFFTMVDVYSTGLKSSPCSPLVRLRCRCIGDIIYLTVLSFTALTYSFTMVDVCWNEFESSFPYISDCLIIHSINL